MSDVEIIYSREKGFFQRDLPNIPETINDGDIIVRPKRVGICGSDLTFLENVASEEICLGHEWVGEVAVTSKNSKYKKGDLVTSGAIIGCEKCAKCKKGLTNFCADAIYIGSVHKGMLRSWAVVPERGVVKAPNKSLDAIPLLEVAAVADEAFNQLKELSPEKSKLLILGCGPVGLFTALKAKKEGYDFDVIEIEASRIKRALDLGLPAKSLGEFLLDRANFNKYNLLIDCAGDAGGKPGMWKYFNLLFDYNMKGVIVGKYSKDISLNAKVVGEKAITFKWMRGMALKVLEDSFDIWDEDIEGLTSVFISHTFNKNEVSKAFDVAKNRKLSMKVMIDLES